MHWAVLALAVLLAAAAAALPSPTSFYADSIPVANLTSWQLCFSRPVTDTSFTLDHIIAQCGGGQLLVACAVVGDNTVLYGASGAANATVVDGGALTNSLPPGNNFAWVRNSSTWSVATSAATCSAVVGGSSGACYNMAGSAFSPGAYCGATLGYSSSSSTRMVVYSNPCDGVPTGGACPSSLGQCAISATCSANGTCVSVPVQQPDNSCISSWSCDSRTNATSTTYADDGTLCADSNYCTLVAQCVSQVCVANYSRTCTPLTPCFTNGFCNATSQECQFDLAPVGTACSGATTCRTAGQCTDNGTCATNATTAPPLNCQTPYNCSESTGWLYTPTPYGTPCTSTNLCLSSTFCAGNGTCVGTGAYCPPLECYTNERCVSYGGYCIADAEPVGTACDDGNPCTSGTTCGAARTCGGGSAVISCSGMPTPPPCQRWLPTAVNATTCMCMLQPLANGTACDDGILCTDDDVCYMGVCNGTPVTCPGDDCNYALPSCSNTTRCSDPKPDDTPCNQDCRINGKCLAGVCGGGSFNLSDPSCVPSRAGSVEWWLGADRLW